MSHIDMFFFTHLVLCWHFNIFIFNRRFSTVCTSSILLDTPSLWAPLWLLLSSWDIFGESDHLIPFILLTSNVLKGQSLTPGEKLKLDQQEVLMFNNSEWISFIVMRRADKCQEDWEKKLHHLKWNDFPSIGNYLMVEILHHYDSIMYANCCRHYLWLFLWPEPDCDLTTFEAVTTPWLALMHSSFPDIYILFHFHAGLCYSVFIFCVCYKNKSL